jgi:hypothetical protein
MFGDLHLLRTVSSRPGLLGGVCNKNAKIKNTSMNNVALK